jgi:hypothetical protein
MCLISWSFDTFQPLPLCFLELFYSGRNFTMSLIIEAIAASALSASPIASPISQYVGRSSHASKQRIHSIVPRTALRL